MKRLFVGVLLAMFSTAIWAGYIEEYFKSGPREKVCQWAANQVGYAINRRVANVPMIMKDRNEITKEIKSLADVPKDAIYVTGWDQFDAKDKALMTKFVKFGYTIAERKLKVEPDATFPKSFGVEYAKFLSTCNAYRYEQDEELGLMEIGFKPVGINTELLLCQELAYDIKLIAQMLNDGAPLEDMIMFAEQSPELRQDRLERIIRQLKEAYAYNGPIVDWMNKEYKECSTVYHPTN